MSVSYFLFYYTTNYYLNLQHIIETDHANLVWMEKSEVAIIMRWRLYLQGFAFKIRHIPGKANIFADMLSRMYCAPLPAYLQKKSPPPCSFFLIRWTLRPWALWSSIPFSWGPLNTKRSLKRLKTSYVPPISSTASTAACVRPGRISIVSTRGVSELHL